MSEEKNNNLLQEGLILVRLGRYKQALPKLAQAAAESPENALVLWAFGEALVNVGDTKEGIAQLHNAMTLTPTLGFSYNSLISAYLTLKNYEKAGEAADLYLKNCPENPEAHTRKAMVLILSKQGTQKEIMSLLNFARSKDPNDNLTTSLISEMVLKTSKTSQEVDAHFEEMLRYFPDSAYYHYRYGTHLAMQGQFTRAEEELTTAFKLSPDDTFIGEAIELVRKIGSSRTLGLLKYVDLYRIRQLQKKYRRKLGLSEEVNVTEYNHRLLQGLLYFNLIVCVVCAIFFYPGGLNALFELIKSFSTRILLIVVLAVSAVSLTFFQYFGISLVYWLVGLYKSKKSKDKKTHTML